MSPPGRPKGDTGVRSTEVLTMSPPGRLRSTKVLR